MTNCTQVFNESDFYVIGSFKRNNLALHQSSIHQLDAFITVDNGIMTGRWVRLIW